MFPKIFPFFFLRTVQFTGRGKSLYFKELQLAMTKRRKNMALKQAMKP